MKANYDNLHSFVSKNGEVTVVDSLGRARRLPSGEADVLDVIEKADRFMFRNKWYGRGDFETLMDKLS
jgi:hypothetical protein